MYTRSGRETALRLAEIARGLNRMAHSMTGFASAEARLASFRIVWEVRSVNHRFLELGVRMPEDLRALEPECRDLVGGALKRGKVDCTLKLTAAPSSRGLGHRPFTPVTRVRVPLGSFRLRAWTDGLPQTSRCAM